MRLAWWSPPGRWPSRPGTAIPAPRELIARYGRRSNRDLSAIDWYVVLGCFKLGIVGMVLRALAGQGLTRVGFEDPGAAASTTAVAAWAGIALVSDLLENRR